MRPMPNFNLFRSNFMEIIQIDAYSFNDCIRISKTRKNAKSLKSNHCLYKNQSRLTLQPTRI